MRRAVTKSIAIIGKGETEWFYFDSLLTGADQGTVHALIRWLIRN